MIARVVVATLVATVVTGCASPSTATVTRWNPHSAVSDAQRDIAAGHIRFAYIGGRESYAPGLPEDGHTWLYVLHHYPQLEVGPQDCEQDQYFAERKAYATRYNHVMWSYVSKHQ
jgi:hypothetical protein